MNHINPHKAGLALGSLTGGAHIVWSILVLLGWAGPLINFIFWAHMVEPTYQVGVFAWTQAIILIIVTALIGYVVGRVFGLLWNKMQG